MCVDEQWDTASGGSDNADVLGSADGRYWKELEQTYQLILPIQQAIHSLEADTPLLSQVYPVWSALKGHFIKWHQLQGVSRQLRQGVQAVIERRFKKHVTPAVVAAFLFDSAQAVRAQGTSDAWCLPFDEVRDQALLSQAFDFICRITKADKDKAQSEWWVQF